MKTQIGITDENRLAVSDQLCKLLSDESVLHMKTKNAHWNVIGHDFFDKHTFFEIQFGEIDKMIDSIAERIRTIGHFAPATMASYLSLTHLTEKNQFHNDNIGFMKELLMDHESIILFLREQIKPFANNYHDAGSSDFITGIMEIHEKMAWFLRAHLTE